MGFRLFVFDFDGTLADSWPWLGTVFNRAAERFRFRQLDEREFEALRGRDNRSILRELGVPLWRLPQIAAYLRQLAGESASAPLFPGVPDMLQRVHRSGVRLALVSSNSEATVQRALGPECASFIHAYACNASMFGKAAKFKRLLREMKIEAGEAIAIGDETRDIEAARAAGTASGVVSWGYAERALLAAHAPDYVFDTPEEIAALAEGAGKA